MSRKPCKPSAVFTVTELNRWKRLRLTQDFATKEQEARACLSSHKWSMNRSVSSAIRTGEFAMVAMTVSQSIHCTVTVIFHLHENCKVTYQTRTTRRRWGLNSNPIRPRAKRSPLDIETRERQTRARDDKDRGSKYNESIWSVSSRGKEMRTDSRRSDEARCRQGGRRRLRALYR